MPLLVGGCKLRCPSKLWKEPQLDISIKNNVWKWQRTSCRENNHSCPEVQVPHSRWILLNSIRTSKANTLFLKRKGLYNFKATIMPLKPSKDHLLTKGRHWQNNNKYPSKKKKKIVFCFATTQMKKGQMPGTDWQLPGEGMLKETGNKPEKATLSQQMFWCRRDSGHQWELDRICLRLQRSQGGETLA